jgi:hypothetical protein
VLYPGTNSTFRYTKSKVLSSIFIGRIKYCAASLH